LTLKGGNKKEEKNLTFISPEKKHSCESIRSHGDFLFVDQFDPNLSRLFIIPLVVQKAAPNAAQICQF